MPWILDGSNLAGGVDREKVRRAALTVARSERIGLLVFFDGPPPPGSASTVRLGTVELRYVPHADSAIVAHLTGAGTGWILATDDRALGQQAKSLGARVVAAAAFWAKAGRTKEPDGGGSRIASVDDELAYFHDGGQRLPAEPARVRRRRRR